MTGCPRTITIYSDYRANSVLDRYEDEGIDHEYGGEDDAAAALAARRAAERELDRRDVREGKRGRRLPGALGVCGCCNGQQPYCTHQPQRRIAARRTTKHAAAAAASVARPTMPKPTRPTYVERYSNEYTHMCTQAPLQVDLDGYEGPVPEFLAQEPVQREVARRFRIFLRTFADDKGEEVYQSRLRNLGSGTQPRVFCVHMHTWKPSQITSSRWSSTLRTWQSQWEHLPAGWLTYPG